MLGWRCGNLKRGILPFTSAFSSKGVIDYSQVPVLHEQELDEQFTKGSGPGGQSVQKTVNCVILKHLPTGQKPLAINALPVIEESDLEEHFIRGSGPGGSAVNKTSNCVLLKHLPTGIVVRCHESRLLQENQRLARKILKMKLDEKLNGEMSIAAQKKRMFQQKSAIQQEKAEKTRTLKAAFKQREGID